jgi:hypothetical protein
MEIKIVITKQNKEKILKLIDQLVECEAEGISVAPLEKELLTAPGVCSTPTFLEKQCLEC